MMLLMLKALCFSFELNLYGIEIQLQRFYKVENRFELNLYGIEIIAQFSELETCCRLN